MGVNARQSKVGIAVATSGSWGTSSAVATAVGAGDGHYVRDDLNIQLKQTRVKDDTQAQGFIGSVQISKTEAIESAIPLFLHYMDLSLNPLWALAFGTGGTAPTQLSTSTAYTNTFEPATNKTGLYATIVRDKVQMVSEVPGAKFTGFTLKSGENGRLEVDFQFIGDTEKSDSTINTATQISALTFPTLGYRAFFSDLVFRVNAQAGGALAGSDALKITSITVTFKQPLDMKIVGGQRVLIEPEENAMPECTIDIVFARYDAASLAFFAAHRDGTRYKADITITGPAIGALATTYGLLFQFPNLDVPDYKAPIPGNASQSAPTAKFDALSTTAAPTGMTGVTKPLRLVTTGTSSANPFV
ncbi:MAG: phage tail tube protein [Acidobacteriota bacterium]|nr:phage tail tube protein [Acidobacteriota bacterium]